MKKILLAFVSVSLFSLSYAAETREGTTRVEGIDSVDLERAQQECKVIKVELLVYPDTSRSDLSDWHEAVSQVLEVTRSSEKDPEWLDKLCLTVLSLSERSRGKNVHGQVRIALGDGKCPAGVCNENCECLKQYNGLCPCGLETTGKCCGAKE